MKFIAKDLLSSLFVHHFTKALTVTGLFLAAQQSMSIDYGIYDARSLAMGGTGVASASSQHAIFYNPALLAFYEGKEEDTRHGYVNAPMLVFQVNNAVQDAFNLVDDELDDALADAVEAYNLERNDDTSAAVAEAGTELRSGIDLVGNRFLEGEAFIGFMVSEPSDREGGSFYFGSRVLAGGNSTVVQDDLDLLNNYILAVQSATPEADFPELFNDLGQLVDPVDVISSSADISSLILTEWGVAISREFEPWGLPVSLGFTPKVMHVQVYRDEFTYSDSDYNYEEDKRSSVTMNADVGIALPLGKYFRIGYAAKDIIPQEFLGGNGLSVKTEARTRLAGAFVHPWVSVSMDMDLQTNEPLSGGRSGRELGIGIEISAIPWLRFRNGYRHDLEGLEDDILSLGAGIRLGRIVGDAAYSFSEDAQGASLQFGWIF